ncbi:hypothetical protein I6A84_06515 [Frankia sp. CNm7]|uniref:DUF3558 domain-containing protein n=1 Tax=Frankia nepalensis TaxID=1836974 RepID=A0A937RF41_9ACTN|nr:hypothetical protein [Frankia nepalensis]MBL7500344.1 hypothetical protein [Frankia nepalensis]MBL7508566.1 hypothetical protein [Frankia nepalensis]MBL7517786.1 hypothetical protein [Frankia nepalensis]MBL7627694.1 hypothetical protein [Frankia nepalensis]
MALGGSPGAPVDSDTRPGSGWRGSFAGVATVVSLVLALATGCSGDGDGDAGSGMSSGPSASTRPSTEPAAAFTALPDLCAAFDPEAYLDVGFNAAVERGVNGTMTPISLHTPGEAAGCVIILPDDNPGPRVHPGAPVSTVDGVHTLLTVTVTLAPDSDGEALYLRTLDARRGAADARVDPHTGPWSAASQVTSVEDLCPARWHTWTLLAWQANAVFEGTYHNLAPCDDGSPSSAGPIDDLIHDLSFTVDFDEVMALLHDDLGAVTDASHT